MAERKIITQGYKSHVAEVQRHWEGALAAEGYDAALIHAGSKLVSFLDDYEYPFRCALCAHKNPGAPVQLDSLSFKAGTPNHIVQGLHERRGPRGIAGASRIL